MSEMQENTEQPIDPTRDHFLASLVNVVNTGGFQFNITLNVAGVMISGRLISGKQYFDSFADTFSTSSNGGESEAAKLRGYISSFGDIYDEDPSPIWEDVTFIHLEDAQFHFSNRVRDSNQTGELWRGKLASVDGFYLGWAVVRADNA